MGYNGKLPGKDELANLIISALREDKKDVVINAEIQAEINQASFDKAQKEVDKLSKPRKVDVDTSKAEKKLENLTDALADIHETIKDIATENVGFNDLHNVTKQYEGLKKEIYDVADAVDESNSALKESQKVIRHTDRLLRNLSITRENVTKKARKKASQAPIVEDMEPDIVHTPKPNNATKYSADTIKEVTTRISRNSSIAATKSMEAMAHEAVNVTKALSEMYDEGIRDTERYITLQYKLKKLFDAMGKSYGGVRKSGAKNGAELLDLVIDGIVQRTGVNLFGDSRYAGIMENLFGDSDFSLFNKSLSKLGMKDISELLLSWDKTGDWVDVQAQVTDEIEKTVVATERMVEVSSTPDVASNMIKSYDELKSILEECESLASQIVEHKVPRIIHLVEGGMYKPINSNYLTDETLRVSLITDAWNEYKKLEGTVESTNESLVKAREAVIALAVDYARSHKDLSALNNADLELFTRGQLDEYSRAKRDEEFDWSMYGRKTKQNQELTYKIRSLREGLLYDKNNSQIFTDDVHSQILNYINQIVIDGAKANDVLEATARLMGVEIPAATEKSTAAKVKYYEIDEKAARLSKQNRSFDDYKEGSATASYRASVDKIAEIVEEKKKQAPDKSDRLDQLFDRYAKNLAYFINRDNQIGAQYPSVMISGAGNYNIKKHDRQMASWGKNYQYYEDSVLAIENKIRSMGGSGAEVIRGDEEDALDKLEAKLEYMKYWHQVMVEVNKYYRKNKTIEGFEGAEPDEIERIKKALVTMQQLGMHNVPYPSYALTNDNQNIKRIEGRITELKRLKDNDGLQEENDIYKLWTDKQDMRIRISFEMGKPDKEIIDMLKGKGFHWSRNNNAWQRQLTDNAIYATKQLQKSLHEFYKIEEQAQSATAAIESQTKATEKLAETRLKLTPKKDGNYTVPETYTALDGKYEVSKGKDGWDVYQRDNAGLWNLIGTYKHLDDIRKDTSLLNREEIVLTDEIVQEVKVLQEAYSSMDQQIRGHVTIVNKYIEVLSEVKRGAMGAAYAISQLNEAARAKGLMIPDSKAAQEKMSSTIRLIGELQAKYGIEKFGEIFGDVGAIDVSNAEAVYDSLIAKEKEYGQELVNRANAIAEFTKQNSELIGQFANTVNFNDIEVKIGEISAGIFEGSLSLEEANRQLQEFASTLSEENILLGTTNNTSLSNIYDNEELSAKISQFKELTEDELQAALKNINLDKFFAQFNVPAEHIDVLKEKFIDLVKTFNANDHITMQPIFDSMIDDIEKLGGQIQSVDKLYEDFQKRMVGVKVQYNDAIMQEYGKRDGGWSEFAKANRDYISKSLKSKNKNVVPADVLMMELVEQFSGLFSSEDLEKPIQDQFIKIMEVWAKARQETHQDAQELVSFGKSDRSSIADSILDAFTISSNDLLAYQDSQNNQIAEEKKIQAKATEKMTEATYSQVQAEKELAEVAQKTTENKAELVSASNDLTNAEEEVAEAARIAEIATKRVVENIREAAKISGAGFLENVKSMSDIEGALSETFSKEHDGGVYRLRDKKPISVKDDTAQIHLISKDEKWALDYVVQLKDGLLEIKSVSQDLLSLKGFDSESAQNAALSSIEKIRADAERAKYDLSELRNQAKAIASADDVTKFNSDLKVAQNEIQAIKNSTATKSSMNPLINMQRDMKVANIEIDTMQLKLDKLGEVDGVEKAADMIADMRTAVEDYNKATTSEAQQKAYNDYSDLRHSFKAQMEYINAAKTLNDSQKSTKKQTDPIREQYQTILDLVNKINAVSVDITKYQSKDGGSGIFAGYISQLQSEKQVLVSELQGITQEINSTLGVGFVQGKEFTVPFASFLDDSGAISSFLNDTRTQASLTTEEIEKLVEALRKSQNIDVEAAAKVTEQFKSVQETYKRLSELTGLDKNNQAYQGLVNIFGQIMQYKDQLSSDPTSWAPDESARLQKLIEQFTQYGNALADAGEKEAKYFANKTKYSEGQTAGALEKYVENQTKSVDDVQKRLEESAKKFAKDSGFGDAFITNFSQTADGISKLDFSVFDKGSNSLRTFRMEMGSVTDGIYRSETTIVKSLNNIQAAQKQVKSISDLISRLGQSGIDINPDTATGRVAKLLELMKALQAQTSLGDKADQGLLSKLMKDAKLTAAEVEKLYRQMIQMENAVVNGDVKDVFNINLNADKYSQMTAKIEEFAAAFPNAVLQVGKLNETTGKLPFTITDANGVMTTFEARVDSLTGSMTIQEKSVSQVGTAWGKFAGGLAKTGRQLMTALVGYNAFYKVISEVRKGIGYVKDIDLALTELKKVTDETEGSYRRFLQTAAETSGMIGSTVSDFTDATANFARLGYTMEESADMAKTAVVYKNVADGLDTVEEATDSIISTMKAFGIESDNTMQIIDIFNEVGNNFAITSAGIGEAMQRSASALYEAGNSIEESTALITAANSVIQNPEQVGTALKTLALRLRGAKVALEEAGLETEYMAETTAQLQDKLLALTGGKVDIMIDNDTFKNTTQILREMSAVWEEMTDIEQASALELMGGKRQAKRKNCPNVQKCA